MTAPHDGGLAVGVDVGGTKLAAGLVASDGSVLARVRHPTPQSGASEIVDVVVSTAEEFAREYGLREVAVGVGAAGLIDPQGTVRYAPNLPWADFALGAELSARLAGPVTVDNDANAAAWGEYRAGAGRGAHRSMVMLTLGTGVGGGLVLNDRLVRGAGGMAGELGHMAVVEGGPRCPCGARGCLESLASGTAIARLAREAIADGRVSSGGALLSMPPDGITGKSVTVAAHAGDRDARAVLAAAGRWLGVGIASLVAAFDPQIVVLGGGAMQAGTLLTVPAVEAAQSRLVGRGHRELAPIIAAQLGDDAGLVGAALLALEAPVPG